MAPSNLLAAALFTSTHAISDLDEASMLQMPVVNQELGTDEDECRCPGYYQAECEAEARQGCVWSDAGESNEHWCQCGTPPEPEPAEPEPGNVYDCEICRQLAEARGLEIGGVGWDFEGPLTNYAPGCYTYISGQYTCHAYCGTGATLAAIAEPLARSDRAKLDSDFTVPEQCAIPVTTAAPPAIIEYTDVGFHPRNRDAGDAPFGIEVVVDPPERVTNVTVISDWWMKRPKDMVVYIVDSNGVATQIAAFEYPTTTDICGANGDEECSYPERPTSRMMIPVDSDIVASAVRVAVLTPRNEAGQPNGQVIIQNIQVTVAAPNPVSPPAPAPMINNWNFEQMTVDGTPGTLEEGKWIHFLNNGNSGLTNTGIPAWQYMGTHGSGAGLFNSNSNEIAAEGSHVLFINTAGNDYVYQDMLQPFTATINIEAAVCGGNGGSNGGYRFGLYSEDGTLVEEKAAGVNGAPECQSSRYQISYLSVSVEDHPEVVGQTLQLRLMKNRNGQGHYHYIRFPPPPLPLINNWNFESMTVDGAAGTLEEGKWIHFLNNGNSGLTNTGIPAWQYMGTQGSGAGLFNSNSNEIAAEGSHVLFINAAGNDYVYQDLLQPFSATLNIEAAVCGGNGGHNGGYRFGLYTVDGTLVAERVAGADGAPECSGSQYLLSYLSVSADDHPEYAGQTLQIRLMKNRGGQGHFHYVRFF